MGFLSNFKKDIQCTNLGYKLPYYRSFQAINKIMLEEGQLKSLKVK